MDAQFDYHPDYDFVRHSDFDRHPDFDFVRYFTTFAVLWFMVYLIGIFHIVRTFIVPTTDRRNFWSYVAIRGRDVRYAPAWNIFTRLVSNFHAFTVVYYSFYIIYNYYGFNPTFDNRISFLWKFASRALDSPQGLYHFKMMSCFMGTYLLVDGIFMLYEQTEKNMMSGVLHHTIGSIGMLGFCITGLLPYDGIFFALTEITTVPLNLVWIMMYLKPKDVSWTGAGKFIFTGLSLLTWILFLFFRVYGSAWILKMIYDDLDLILTFPVVPRIICLVANIAISILNVFWFAKLTRACLTFLL